VATVAAIAGGFLLSPVDGAAVVSDVEAGDARLVTGVLLELVLVIAVVGIAVMAFPVLRRQDEGLALAYVGARTLEAGVLLAASMSALVVVETGRRGGDIGDGEVALAARETTYLVGSMVMLGIGGLVLYALLLRSRLVPAWLAAWGLAGAALVLLRGVLEVYGLDVSPGLQVVLTAPIALNEMVLAVRLILKGFDEPPDAARAPWPAPAPRAEPGTGV
jgi:Domain of unknown function (DUF4386)